jgi:CheY-like chemotaxis protein
MADKKIKVLIVDDDESSVNILSQYLQKEETLIFEVDSAPSGQRALYLSEFNRYDLIFSDINMPEIDGLDYISRLRSLTINEQTPIVIYSAMKGVEVEDFLHFEPVCYLGKPLKIDDLKKVLEQTNSMI